MAGILNGKTRFFDSVLTDLGKQQLSAGKLRIEYASFSDRESFYEKDAISGSSDASSRLYLEAGTLNIDQITFETDDSGRLYPFRGSDVKLVGDKILTGSSIATGSIFLELSDTLLSSSLQHFQSLRILGTEDPFLDSSDFILSQDQVQFLITNTKPFTSRDITEISVENSENFFQDSHLSHEEHFMYLPPINKKVNKKQVPLGKYPNLGQQRLLSFSTLKKSLTSKEKVEITFSETSRENNLVIQGFEIAPNIFKKLDAIDFGEFLDTSGDEQQIKRVFFLGKVFVDSKGNNTYINMFTLIFE